MLRTALVTGANKGIGYQICVGLLNSKKFRVVLACRNEELANKAAAQLALETKCPSENILVLPGLDLLKPETIKEAAQKLARAYSTSATVDEPFLDVLVNNAGFAFSNDALEPVFVQAKTTVGINYFGTKEVCKHFIPFVVNGGRVINVSSRAGLVSRIPNKELQDAFLDKNLTVEKLEAMLLTYFGLTAQEGGNKHIEAGWPSTTYMVSKIAESALTRILAHLPENTSRNLTISTYTPGYCKTDMTGWAEDAARTAAQGAETAVWLAVDDDEALKMNGQFLDEEQKRISYFDGARL